MFWFAIFAASFVMMSIESIILLKKHNKDVKQHEENIKSDKSYYGSKPHISSSTILIVYICIVVTSGFITIIHGVDGMLDYPSLIKQWGHVEALQNRVEDIRKASYEYKKDGGFVAGSVENLSQSTNLSKYIANLSTKEAEYNAHLQRSRVFKEVFILSFFGNGWAISNKIYDLPEVTK